MATKTKADPLARYFKDLNDSDFDSEESEDESQVCNKSKTEDLDLSMNNSSDVKSGNSDSSIHRDSSCLDQEVAEGNKTSTDLSTSLNVKNICKKLPSASECLSSQSNPQFLNLNKKREMNWDISFKKLDEEGSEPLTGEYKPNAVPPPESYEPVTDPGIKIVDSEGRKRKTFTDDPEDESSPAKASHQSESQDL